MNNLCLGSAQFGLNYGISNFSGKIKSNEVERILKYSYKNDVQRH